MMKKTTSAFPELLDSIQQVEPPAYLFERITARISREAEELVKPVPGWSVVVSFFLLLLINFISISKINNSHHRQSDLIQTFELMPENNLYQ